MRSPVAMKLVWFAWLLWSNAALADAYDAALMRAVAAKELAMDAPSPLQWQTAFERFREVDNLSSSAETQYELGFIAAQLRQMDLAVEYYEAALALGLTGPATAKALAFVDIEAPRMARIFIRGKRGSRVRIRGIERALLPLSRPLVSFAGATPIELAEPSSNSPSRRTVTLAAGQLLELDWNTELAPPVEPAPMRVPQLPIRASTAPPADSPPPIRRDNANGSRAVGRWLVGSGAGVLLSSGALLVVSTMKLSDQRKQLREACEEPLPGSSDGCQSARYDRYEEASALADDIARWRTIQGGAWIGLGLGTVGSLAGWMLLVRSPTVPTTAAHWVPTPVLDRRGAALYWRRDF